MVTGMATFTRSDELQGAEFVDANLRGARFVRADLSGVVMRAVDVAGADIDAPWLFDGESWGETWFMIYRSEYAQPGDPTRLKFEVDHLRDVVAQLRARGVAFEERPLRRYRPQHARRSIRSWAAKCE